MIIVQILLGLAAVMAAVMSARLGRSLRRFRMDKEYPLPDDAPTVSVCIPARNETHAMTQCLERVLASDYKKLEIIVFDDSSADDTSVLIRSFAHAGVRFVPGTKLPDGWLGKNHALEVLAREASGSYVVFMDVDTQIATTTISRLVGYVCAKNAEMLSVVPARADAWRASVLLGHLRYFWALILSRPNAPAAASSLWMVRRQTLLEKFGGFAQFKAGVAPEIKIAALLGASAYRCLVADRMLDVTYEKKWSSQVETARRLLYPMAGARAFGGALAVAALLLLNVPTVVVLSGFVAGWSLPQVAALILLIGLMAMYGMYLRRVWRGGWWLGGVLWPVVVLQEFVLLLSSIWGYARHTITWKGRSVTSAAGRVDSLIINR